MSNKKKTKSSTTNNNNKKTVVNGSGASGSSLLNVIILIVAAAITFFMFLSCFGVCGVVGNFISWLLFGCFGVLAYFVPWLIFIGILLLMSNKGNRLAIIKVIAGCFFVVFLAAFVWLIVPAFNKDSLIIDYFAISVADKSYGGLFGGAILKLLYMLAGRVGSFVIVILVLIIAIVIISERSILSRLNKERAKKVIDNAKDDAEYRKKSRELIKEKRRLERQEQLVAEDEEWQAERQRRRAELEERKEKLAAMKGDVTFDTKIIPPDQLPKQPEPEKKVKKEEKNNLSQAISSQNVTEIFIDPDEFDSIFEDNSVNADDSMVVDELMDVQDEITYSMDEDNQYEFANDQGFIEPVKTEKQVKKENLTTNVATNIDKDKKAKDYSKYRFPPKNLLESSNGKSGADAKAQSNETANKLISTLETFGVKVKLTNVSVGPTVTRYELQPEQGVKVSKIISLTDDIKLNLAASDIRIEAPIPNKAAIGIEVPNKTKAEVKCGDLIRSKEFNESLSKLSFAVGKDIGGNVIIADIAKMPHVLIAGATGSGKSVCVNTIIMSVLYKAKPDEVKMIMIDPKVVELSIYNGIPHLMIPVVTDPKKAAGALNWAVNEMTNRYQAFANECVRDIKGYNKKMEEKQESPDYDEILHKKLPQLLIIVDELADLMMVAAREVEESICRLAQLARAAGIHLVIATQRPSVDVITGLIKANMPSRMAFSVSSGVDSRTIIDMNGAEKLLGHGDMLFYPQGYSKPLRVQGSFVSDEEVAEVAAFVKNQACDHEYDQSIVDSVNSSVSVNVSITNSQPGNDSDTDELFIEAGKIVIEQEKASIGNLQRRLRIGFNRAARIMDQLCEAGVVGEEEGTKPRTILMSMEEFEQYIEEYY